ncbi:NfeD family protein [candidate division KSB1 bacterium]|nr:NfeD family protein [candidate division KSB1 bacterium]
MEALKELVNPALVWFIIGLLLLFWEFAMPGFVIFFFGVGAIMVSIVCIFADYSLNIQLLLFLVFSLTLLLSLRRWMHRIFHGYVQGKNDSDQNIDTFIGEHAAVIEEIQPGKLGKVEFHGSTWKAEADKKIAAGTRVIVVSKDNLTLKVKSI